MSWGSGHQGGGDKSGQEAVIGGQSDINQSDIGKREC